MKSNKKSVHMIVFYLLLFAPFLVAIASMPFLPNKIPIHSDLNGIIDRYGSKYEIFILPLLNTIFGLLYLFWAKKSSSLSGIILIWGANVAMCIFNIITYTLIVSGFEQSDTLLPALGQIMFVIAGVVFIVLSLLLYLYIKKKYKEIGNQKISFAVVTAITGFVLIALNLGGLRYTLSNILSICLLILYVVITIFIYIVIYVNNKK